MQNQLPGAPAGTLIVNADGSDAVIIRDIDCVMITLACAFVLSVAIGLMVLVSNVDFDDGQQVTPSAPGNCQPFCPISGG
ncbi:hypothetical protein JK358_07940 [Nocardia sp. 2]|uniref:Uncharacterized protein n=1 Tax=Nocardia acididurans TaxID=2802282 RepID=A0ABS1M1D1_9NOCA|nr:hypothetical protein [Nocardia acididurans]MBL1074326.1 hypothetical protein [Nocardia acididurans]